MGSLPCLRRARGRSPSAAPELQSKLGWRGRARHTQAPRGRPSPDDTAARPPPRPARPRPAPPTPGCSLQRCRFPVHQTSLAPLPNISRALGCASFSTSCAFHLLPALGPTVSIFSSLQSHSAFPFTPTLGDQDGERGSGAADGTAWQLPTQPKSHPLLIAALQKLTFPTSFHPLLTEFFPSTID